MFSQTKHPVSKLGTLAATALLLVGFSAALNWNTPENYVISGKYELNVSTGGVSTQIYFEDDDGSWNTIGSSSSSTFLTPTWDTASPGSGEYTLIANATDGSQRNISVTVDNTDPSVSSLSPADGNYIQDDSPKVSYSTSETPTNFTNKYINVTDADGNLEYEDSDISVGADDLDEDTYTAFYEVRDFAGNWNNGSWSFTVDTSKDFTLNPGFDPSPGIVDWTGEFELDVTIDENNETADVTLKCLDSDGDTIDSDTGGGTEFTCTIDDEYRDETVDMEVEVCDKADNCKTSDAHEFTFDGSDPSLFSGNTPASIVNTDFPVEYSAADASGIEQVEYFYDNPGTAIGSGTKVGVNRSEGEFEASVSGLSKGEHMLYFRVKDGAGRWSSTESVKFEFRPNANPEVDLRAPGNVSVKAGGSTQFYVTAENTGELYIPELVLSFNSSLVNGSGAIEDLGQGNVSTVRFDATTSESDVGVHLVQVSSTSPDALASFRLLVEATREQRNELDSNLSDYESKLDDLERKISGKRADLGSDLERRLDANFSTFRQRVEQAREAKKNGEYYRVASSLEGIDTDYQSAKTSFQNVKEIDNSRDLKRNILIAAIVLVLGAGVTAFFLYRSDRYGLDLEFLDLDLDSVGDLGDRVRGIVRGAEEEAEEHFEWDGFED